MRGKQLLFGIAITAIVLSCSSQKKNIDIASSQESAKPSAPFEQTIEMYSILAQGKIIVKDEQLYFVVSNILKRGRQAPTVLAGQQLLLFDDNIDESLPGKAINALLKCDEGQQEDKRWTIQKID